MSNLIKLTLTKDGQLHIPSENPTKTYKIEKYKFLGEPTIFRKPSSKNTNIETYMERFFQRKFEAIPTEANAYLPSEKRIFPDSKFIMERQAVQFFKIQYIEEERRLGERQS